MPKNRRGRGSPSRSPSEVRGTTKKEKQTIRQREERMFEKERRRAEAGRKGALRAFTASQSDSDLSEQVAMEAEQEEEQELGAAAPAEEGNKKYFEDQKKRRRQTHMRKTETRRGRERKRRKHTISATKLKRAMMSGSGTIFQR